VGTLSGRLPLWQEAWKAALKRPWLGHGFEAYWDAKNIRKYTDQFHWQIPHAHNAYIDFVLAVGFVGLAAYMAWSLASIGVAWRRYEQAGRLGELFVMSVLTLILVHGVTESKFPGAGVGGLLQMCALVSLIVRPATGCAEKPAPRESGDRWRNLRVASPARRPPPHGSRLSGRAVPRT
jgi:O-antigen ligase